MSKPTVPSLPSPAVSFVTTTVTPAADSRDQELTSLRAELARCRAIEAELMQLLGTKRSDRIIHDVRNLLQERIFLLAACRDPDEK